MGAQKVVTTFRSDDGLNVESEPIREAVEHVSKGIGKVSAIARKKRRFNSNRKPQTVTIEEDETAEPTIVKVARQIARALGR